MALRVWIAVCLLCLAPLTALADDRLVRLHAPAGLDETGLLKHILPRFSLKTQVRIERVETPEQADLVLGSEGRALFEGAGATWHMAVNAADHPGTQKLADWLTSEIGLNTITGFAPEGTPLFAPPSDRVAEVAAVELEGDPKLGHDVSRAKCARCHVVEEAGRMNSIGSTPSFFVLRSLGDWIDRFSAFYVLNPHPSFTQVDGVTPPFPLDRPSPIVPVVMTLDELSAIMAYVGSLSAADLGAPIQHQ
ncbi:hypothetical protein KUH32_06595 [Thalassococcus sp. CAU 1522]|uniref:Cytochrome c domain-containing protein n=1 Tax=Thalassococcus arenae TaxID=2851652 RepID=A0ABS6N5Z6_9RHOB|nr:hypothetical protein [Thalassococcus arenae]MBV2359435.1 hypothetical protein [Thalassococcus arenae]